MSTAVARNLMAEMKLLDMFESFDRLLTEATRDQWSCAAFFDAVPQAESDYRTDCRPVLLIGQTGVGKTFIAQALGLQACGSGKTVLYMTFTTWLENLVLARSSGTYLKFRDKMAKPDVVILDDFGMRKLTATEAQDLCELLEERSIDKSTVFTTQLPIDHWVEVIGDPVIADAIRDRLEHAALTKAGNRNWVRDSEQDLREGLWHDSAA